METQIRRSQGNFSSDQCSHSMGLGAEDEKRRVLSTTARPSPILGAHSDLSSLKPGCGPSFIWFLLSGLQS